MIRFAIYLRCQSPRAYESLKESGVLRLPNQATLRDYTNFIQPKSRSGSQAETFQVNIVLRLICPGLYRIVYVLVKKNISKWPRKNTQCY